MHITYEPIDREETPLGCLSLHRYEGSDGSSGYEIRIDDNFLMATHGALGERVMVRVACERLAVGAVPRRVLVGGLGAGHTLRAVLDWPGVERVQVLEIGAKVLEWNRRYFGAINGQAVDDPRVEVIQGDVAPFIAAHPGSFDLVLLDVDNGPGWLAAAGNAGLYADEGLVTCVESLNPGGVLAIWSPNANPAFESALGRVFPGWERVASCSVDPEAGPTDHIYLVRRPAC